MTMHAPEVTLDRFDRIWAGLSTADRIVLLGHDRDVLTAGEKIRLGKVVAALGKAQREATREAPRRSRGSRVGRVNRARR